MREEFLLKVLEYGKMSDLEAFKAIADALGLEFYHEGPSLYTLSSESFLLDISGESCSMIFVEEELNTRLGYIQRYLSHFLPEKHIFYCILRFLTKKSKCTPKPNPGRSMCKILCNCILTGDYCMNFNPGQAADNFNVFTHSVFDPERTKESGMSAYAPATEPLSNLACAFTSAQLFSRHLSREDLYYEEDSIRASGKSVFIDGERSSVASFAFGRGMCLKDSVDAARTFK